MPFHQVPSCDIATTGLSWALGRAITVNFSYLSPASLFAEAGVLGVYTLVSEIDNYKDLDPAYDWTFLWN